MRGNEINDERRPDGWPLATEANQPATPAAAAPLPRLSMQEIDDGWVLPDESPAPTRWAPPQPATPPRLDLNRATLDELCALPGIGRLRARRILSLRESMGRFAAVSDLSEVKGIGAQTLEQLVALVTVAPPDEASEASAQTSPAQSWTGGEAYARTAEPTPGGRIDQSVA